MKRNRILVVGSANMDMVVTTRRFPMPGETVFAGTFGMFPGGKGANQAVAAAKLGGDVTLIARMGKDAFRESLSLSMARAGVQLHHILVDSLYPTGVALITVDQAGQNEIVVVSGSNMRLSAGDLEKKRRLFERSQVLLLQLEIPLRAVSKAAALARKGGAIVILNPAPAQALPDSLLRRVDYLTPNETELYQLSGISPGGPEAIMRASRTLISRGVRNIVVTRGSRGAMLINAEGVLKVPAVKVRPVDTTAAGDAFNGALALALAEGQSDHRAIQFANHVAAFAVTRMGAQSSMPRKRNLKGIFNPA